METWKPVQGYENLYQVSNVGEILSLRTSRLLKKRINRYGYEEVTLSNGKSKNVRVHQVVALAFLHKLEHKTQVNHIDSNKQNNSVTNLEWVTAKENIAHRLRSNKKKKGIKLNVCDVLNIKRLAKERTNKESIAYKFNITPRYVYKILSGEKWNWVNLKRRL